VFRKEVAIGAFLGRFSRDRFSAVFAEFESGAFTIWIWPRTAWAIEAVFLIEAIECLRTTCGASLSFNVYE